MSKKLFLICLFFITSLAIKAQSNGGFSWVISGCCVKITINPEVINNYPLWNLKTGGATYNASTNPDGVIEHCYMSNGNKLAILSALPESWIDFIVITNCNVQPTNGFSSVVVDNCCVTVGIINDTNPKRKWELNLGDGTIITSEQNGGVDIVTHCYKSPDTYEIVVFYEDNGGASTIVNIVDCKPIENCILSNLCWEDFFGKFNCANSVTLKLPNGNIITVPFSVINNPTNYCDDPYYQNPIPASIPVVGGYCEIVAQIIKAIEVQGYSVIYTSTDPLGRPNFACNKGNYDIVGFFFQSEVEVLGIGGDDCNGSNQKFVDFIDPDSCP